MSPRPAMSRFTEIWYVQTSPRPERWNLSAMETVLFRNGRFRCHGATEVPGQNVLTCCRTLLSDRIRIPVCECMCSGLSNRRGSCGRTPGPGQSRSVRLLSPGQTCLV